jgi:hypothetical protein
MLEQAGANIRQHRWSKHQPAKLGEDCQADVFRLRGAQEASLQFAEFVKRSGQAQPLLHAGHDKVVHKQLLIQTGSQR